MLFLDGHRSVRQVLDFEAGRDFRIRHIMQPLTPGESPEPRPVPTQPPAQRQPPVRRGPSPPADSLPPPIGAPPEGHVAQAPRVASSFGALSIRVQPGDAEVLIDGERWQGAPPGERLVVEVAQGTHRVEIRKAGFVSYVAEIEVGRGETATVNVSLPREREP